EDVADVGEGSVSPDATRQGQRSASLAALRVRQIHILVLLELGMDGDVVQAADECVVDDGHTGDRLGVEHVLSYDAKPSGPLGDEKGPTVGQKGHAPGV